MPNLKAICIVAPGHAASTPRLVKNADALSEAGFQVHVVCGSYFPPLVPVDAALFAAAPWDHTIVASRAGFPAVARGFVRRLARRRIQSGSTIGLWTATRAHNPATGRFATAAARVPADFYYSHSLTGLAAAAAAARQRGVRYGFDAEDFHDAETEKALADSAESLARRRIQQDLLPGCAVFTAASPLIARRFAETYGAIATPILNVFPLSHAPGNPSTVGAITAARPAAAYWFSQTVGPGRGLEATVDILARMRVPIELQLRGTTNPAYARHLQDRATRAGLARPICFLPPGPPGEMVRLAAQADLGLSTELSQPLNRDLCLTNKIFVYLLAGIPQLLSTTQAQSAIAPELGAAALLARLDDPTATARLLDEFLADPARVALARREAWELARSRFCWDRERGRLVELFHGLQS